jgi:peroxiredoxin
VAAVRDRLNDFGEAEVVVITFTRQRNLRGYRSRFAAPLTVVTDEDRATYRAYGLGRASLARVYGLGVLKQYGQLMRKGARLQRPTEDTRQLGGDFVVGRSGRLTYVFRSEGPDDRPAVDDLLAAVRQ